MSNENKQTVSSTTETLKHNTYNTTLPLNSPSECVVQICKLYYIPFGILQHNIYNSTFPTDCPYECAVQIHKLDYVPLGLSSSMATIVAGGPALESLHSENEE